MRSALALAALLLCAVYAQAQCAGGQCRPQQGQPFQTFARSTPTACVCTPTSGCGCQGQCAPATAYAQYAQPTYYVQPRAVVYYSYQPQPTVTYYQPSRQVFRRTYSQPIQSAPLRCGPDGCR